MKSKHLTLYAALLLAAAAGTSSAYGQAPEPADIVRTCPAANTALSSTAEEEGPAPAQEREKAWHQTVLHSKPVPTEERTAEKRRTEQPKYAFGVHVGVDLGAAAPGPPPTCGAGP